jgi:hypothetical protein
MEVLKNQIEILKMKSSISQIKTSVEDWKCGQIMYTHVSKRKNDKIKF